MEEVHRTIEAVAHESYGRLVAYLSVHTHDVAAAEDALSEALLAALTTWPLDGLPQNPDAWLLTTARHRLIDRARHERVRAASTLTLQLLTEKSDEAISSDPFPDERLKLLFVCAHPAIAPDVHTPLMLQAVLGLDAAHIARAFLMSPATMGQRLVRAKRQRMPEEPEVRGLLALILHCEARRPARRARDGRYVPLSEQDTQRWLTPMIEEAERELAPAAKHARPGRFQLEAAIQSVHADRARSGRTDWRAIALFYEHLVQLAPTLEARIGRAAAMAVTIYQPSWAVRAVFYSGWDEKAPHPTPSTARSVWRRTTRCGGFCSNDGDDTWIVRCA
jgi:predicted RNA polymerase sigma factor